MNPVPSNVTIYDLARETGVSAATVSRILRGSTKNVRKDATGRADRIFAAADRLGYRINSSARAVSTGKFNAIGLIRSANPSAAAITANALYAIESDLQIRGKQLVAGIVPDDALVDERELPRVLREWSVDGLLITYGHGAPARMIELISGIGIPSIWLNSKMPTNAVCPDDFGGMAMAVKYLLELGHRRIAYVGSRYSGHYSVQDRYSGYVHAMKAAGLSGEVIGDTSESGREDPLKFLVSSVLAAFRRKDRPTAVLCYSTLEATTVIYQISSQLGLRVPKDVSVIGTSEDINYNMGMGITCARIPGYEVSHLAVEMISARIDSSGASDVPLKCVPFTLLEGDTTCRLDG